MMSGLLSLLLLAARPALGGAEPWFETAVTAPDRGAAANKTWVPPALALAESMATAVAVGAVASEAAPTRSAAPAVPTVTTPRVGVAANEAALPLAVSPAEPTVPDTPRLQRWPAWLAVGLGVASAVIGAVFQVQSLQRARLLEDTSVPPGDWADTARAEHQRARRDASVATALFAVGAAAAGVGALVFAW